MVQPFGHVLAYEAVEYAVDHWLQEVGAGQLHDTALHRQANDAEFPVAESP